RAAPLHRDRFGVERAESVGNLNPGDADGLPVDGRVVDVVPGRQLLDERRDLRAVLEDAELRQLGRAYRAAREGHAEGDDLLGAGGDVGQRNELDVDTARRFRRRQERRGEQLAVLQ